jgi:hypothetical protein
MAATSHTLPGPQFNHSWALCLAATKRDPSHDSGHDMACLHLMAGRSEEQWRDSTPAAACTYLLDVGLQVGDVPSAGQAKRKSASHRAT